MAIPVCSGAHRGHLPRSAVVGEGLFMGSDAVRGLVALMAPPAGGGDVCGWDAIFAETGWRFPADYRALVEVFGTGEVVGGVSFGVPPRRGESFDSGILRSRPDRSASATLLWGGSDVGESYHWRCGDADPERWTVVVDPGRGTQADFAMGAVEFLERMLTGSLAVPLALDMAAETHRFIGWRECEALLLARLEDYGFDDV